MPISFACEGLNKVITSVFPNPDDFTPHIALSLAHLTSSPEGGPVVLVSRLSPDEARAVGLQLQACADRVQLKWDEHDAEEAFVVEDDDD